MYQNFASCKVSNSTLQYENLPELPSGFLHPHSFPNTPIIKDKRIVIFCAKKSISTYHSFSLTQKTYPSKYTEVFEREI